MFPSHAVEQTAIALQLAASLDAYEEELDRIGLDAGGAGAHERLAKRFDEIQMYVASLPELSVSWLALMISRAEFMHHLWATWQRGHEADLRLLLDQHREAIQVLRARCTHMMRRI